ncbi:MAG: radical SAM protein, partial [Syntrophomonadaceae bacterium]
MAFPGRELICQPHDGPDHIRITIIRQGDYASCNGEVEVEGRSTRVTRDFHLPPDEADIKTAARGISRRFVMQLLRLHLGEEVNPYGTLTGVRPVKIVHRLLDQGWEQGAILEYLQNRFLINRDKAQLLQEVAAANRSFLLDREQAYRLLSVYIGIPFCPSRCCYCSFPGSRIGNYDLDVGPFMQALLTEMEKMGEAIAGQGWKIEAVYLGGGTPTVLSPPHLESIFEVLHARYISAETREITVEAGRPDTITGPGLDHMRRLGVNRVCVNPQTMDDDTLRLIGRHHDARMVREAVERVRQAGIKYINMDLIVGLPGESLPHFQNTARQV